MFQNSSYEQKTHLGPNLFSDRLYNICSNTKILFILSQYAYNSFHSLSNVLYAAQWETKSFYEIIFRVYMWKHDRAYK